MKQQIIQIIESHRPPMVHPTNRSGGEYAVACEVDRILDEVIKDVEKLEEYNGGQLYKDENGEYALPIEDMFKCKDCGHTLVRNRSRGTLYCGICKK